MKDHTVVVQELTDIALKMQATLDEETLVLAVAEFYHQYGNADAHKLVRELRGFLGDMLNLLTDNTGPSSIPVLQEIDDLLTNQPMYDAVDIHARNGDPYARQCLDRAVKLVRDELKRLEEGSDVRS